MEKFKEVKELEKFKEIKELEKFKGVKELRSEGVKTNALQLNIQPKRPLSLNFPNDRRE